MISDAKKIAKLFELGAEPVEAVAYGKGHINDTFLLTTDSGEKYIIQHINKNIFKDISGLMNNIIKVTDHIRHKIIKSNGDALREVLTVVYTKDGKSFYTSDSGFWRCYLFINEAITMQIAETPELFRAAGEAFGGFQNQLSDFDASLLVETIPDFHNTPKRYNDFLSACENDVCDRVKNATDEIAFVKDNSNLRCILTDKLDSGVLPLRVTHNDTKINNVMLDKKTGVPLAVIDLDTVMPGLSAYDFGDSIRSGATYAAEDEKDLEKVKFEIELFDKFAEGFIKKCAASFSKEEVLSLCDGSILMTYECGMRFLTDYLQGDTYFKTGYDEHNLVRCRTQFELVRQMIDKKAQMENIVLKYWNQ